MHLKYVITLLLIEITLFYIIVNLQFLSHCEQLIGNSELCNAT